MTPQNNPPRADETLSLDEAATLLHLGLESMRELVERGAVPAVRLNQKHMVLLRTDVLDYVRTEGRRQAEERRRIIKAGGDTSQRAAPGRRRPSVRTLPDLTRYESTTR